MKKMLTIPGHKGNANHNHTKIPSHTNVGEDAEKKELSHTGGGNVS
jgi:hypothetical protein